MAARIGATYRPRGAVHECFGPHGLARLGRRALIVIQHQGPPVEGLETFGSENGFPAYRLPFAREQQAASLIRAALGL